jgi:hypothetical protein
MATTHIAINQTASDFASRYRNAVAQIRMGVAELGELRRSMYSMQDGEDVTLIETKFGVATGDGATIRDLALAVDALANGTDTATHAAKLHELLRDVG